MGTGNAVNNEAEDQSDGDFHCNRFLLLYLKIFCILTCDVLVLDDDSNWSWSDNTFHAQTNDIWVYFPARDRWQLVSVGGCHRGDSGEIEKQKNVDVTALLVVGALTAAGVMGILAYRLLRSFDQQRGYSYIPDEMSIEERYKI